MVAQYLSDHFSRFEHLYLILSEAAFIGVVEKLSSLTRELSIV